MIPPWDLEAKVLASIYEVRTAARRENRLVTPEELLRVRRDGEAEVHRKWTMALQDARYGRWTIDALLPVLERWSVVGTQTRSPHLPAGEDSGYYSSYILYV
ncbi:unnamed protein product [Danaus chrysippus]|uniref:(African queen) hypothetical protein n=1 Tax=Danaus chrysippus TaxID=151541 RepID=A0A8J2VSZ9_9NEOP|nr:unnamed protein product [Danaus chrysippus]